jgi:hypothetical protein
MGSSILVWIYFASMGASMIPSRYAATLRHSHSTRLSKNASQVAGYQGERTPIDYQVYSGFRSHVPHPETRLPSLREHSAPPHLRLKLHPAVILHEARLLVRINIQPVVQHRHLAGTRRACADADGGYALQPQLIPHLIYLCLNSRVHHDGRTPFASRLARPFVGRIQPHLAA